MPFTRLSAKPTRQMGLASKLLCSQPDLPFDLMSYITMAPGQRLRSLAQQYEILIMGKLPQSEVAGSDNVNINTNRQVGAGQV